MSISLDFLHEFLLHSPRFNSLACRHGVIVFAHSSTILNQSLFIQHLLVQFLTILHILLLHCISLPNLIFLIRKLILFLVSFEIFLLLLLALILHLQLKHFLVCSVYIILHAYVLELTIHISHICILDTSIYHFDLIFLFWLSCRQNLILVSWRMFNWFKLIGINLISVSRSIDYSPILSKTLLFIIIINGMHKCFLLVSYPWIKYCQLIKLSLDFSSVISKHLNHSRWFLLPFVVTHHILNLWLFH